MIAPRFAFFFEELSSVAQRLLAELEGQADARRARGKVTAEVIDGELAAMRAIAARWRMAATRTEVEEPSSLRTTRIRLLEKALRGIRRHAEGNPPPAADVDFAECVATLLWWETSTPDIGAIAATNIILRAVPAEAAA